MTKGRDLNAKADLAARAKLRTLRNAYLSLERSCRSLAAARARDQPAEHGSSSG